MLKRGQSKHRKRMSGRTGGVAHVAESTDGDSDALVVFIDAGKGGWLWIVWHGERNGRVSGIQFTCEYRNTNMSKYHSYAK